MEEQRFGPRGDTEVQAVTLWHARTGSHSASLGAREGARAQIRMWRGELGQRARGRVATHRRVGRVCGVALCAHGRVPLARARGVVQSGLAEIDCVCAAVLGAR